MEKEYIPQELFKHYDIKLFDINRTNNVYDLILKMWNEHKELEERIKKAIEYIEKCNFDNAEILIDMGSEYTYEDCFKETLLEKLKGE